VVNIKNASLSLPYSPTWVLSWQIPSVLFSRVWVTKQGADPAVQISVTQAVLRSLAGSHCLWAAAPSGGLRWAMEERQVCVWSLLFPLVSGKLEISVFQGRGRKVIRAQSASSPMWSTAA